MDYGTIKIPREDYERHNQQRQDLGLSWLEYIDGKAPERGVEVDGDEIAASVSADLLAQLPPRIADELR